jgi:hypothetical protein
MLERIIVGLIVLSSSMRGLLAAADGQERRRLCGLSRLLLFIELRYSTPGGVTARRGQPFRQSVTQGAT